MHGRRRDRSAAPVLRWCAAARLAGRHGRSRREEAPIRRQSVGRRRRRSRSRSSSRDRSIHGARRGPVRRPVAPAAVLAVFSRSSSARRVRASVTVRARRRQAPVTGDPRRPLPANRDPEVTEQLAGPRNGTHQRSAMSASGSAGVRTGPVASASPSRVTTALRPGRRLALQDRAQTGRVDLALRAPPQRPVPRILDQHGQPSAAASASTCACTSPRPTDLSIATPTARPGFDNRRKLTR